MKRISKILPVILAMILLLSITLSSCSLLGGKEETQEDTTPSDVVESGNTESETEPFPELEIVDLGGRTINVLWPELHGDGHYVHNEIAVTETKGDVIDMAVATRNAIVERAYNVKITAETDFISTIPKRVRTDTNAGAIPGYDAVVSTIKFMTTIALESLLTDFNDLTYYDESHPWWNHELMQDFSIADARYFATGDIIYSDDFYPYCTYVNMTVSDQNGLEDDYYQMVTDKTWTLEEFHNRAKVGVTADYNKDCNEWEDYEIAGALVNENFARATYYSAGKGMVSFDDNGYPVWQMTEQYAFPILGKVIHLVHDNKACYNVGQWDDHAIREINLFNGNKGLFLVEELIISERITKSQNAAEFKILPFPLYEEDGEYISVLNDAALIGIPINTEEIDEVGLVLSAMSRESVSTLTPAFFETVLAQRYTQDVDSVKALEIILSSTVAIDVATVQDWGKFMAQFKKLAFEGTTEFSSYYNAHIGEVNSEIATYKELLDALHGR